MPSRVDLSGAAFICEVIGSGTASQPLAAFDELSVERGGVGLPFGERCADGHCCSRWQAALRGLDSPVCRSVPCPHAVGVNIHRRRRPLEILGDHPKRLRHFNAPLSPRHTE